MLRPRRGLLAGLLQLVLFQRHLLAEGVNLPGQPCDLGLGVELPRQLCALGLGVELPLQLCALGPEEGQP